MQIPRILHFDLSKAEGAYNSLGLYPPQISVKSILKPNPSFAIVRCYYLPSRPSDWAGAEYIINGYFANEDYESLLRVHLYAGKFAKQVENLRVLLLNNLLRASL